MAAWEVGTGFIQPTVEGRGVMAQERSPRAIMARPETEGWINPVSTDLAML